jgi:hypothetical protein
VVVVVMILVVVAVRAAAVKVVVRIVQVVQVLHPHKVMLVVREEDPHQVKHHLMAVVVVVELAELAVQAQIQLWVAVV